MSDSTHVATTDREGGVIVLGFDPGSTSTGWCSIDVRGGAGKPIMATFYDRGAIPSDSGSVSTLLRTRPDVVAIERLAGFAYASKGAGVVAGLVASSWVAGLIYGLAFAEGLAIVEMTASEWRKLVLGLPSATDQAIALTIPKLIHGFPAISNVHVRDAAGVALGTAWRLNGRRP